ncbi:hypothetical protein QYE76_050814 [Lolium multiflorum]|uniref:Uncharacterized protein n=1 Tax=Lolium multiflorum TaxID=4521 RepID=A0AAD8SS27_LOLMU|nr:hypothetical protein QYE76_050814 [Lolium multiflorum]
MTIALWDDFTSFEEEKEEEEEEEDDTSSDEPPAKRFCPWPGNLSDFDSDDDDAKEEDEDNEGPAGAAQQDGPEPINDDGSLFKFLSPALVVLFYKNSPPFEKGCDELQCFKALLSSPIETLVENSEEVKNILEEIQLHIPMTLQLKLILPSGQGCSWLIKEACSSGS